MDNAVGIATDHAEPGRGPQPVPAQCWTASAQPPFLVTKIVSIKHPERLPDLYSKIHETRPSADNRSRRYRPWPRAG